MQIRLITTSIKGLPMGESHWCAHPEALVQQARALYAQGVSTRAIARQLGNGIHAVTVWRWVRNLSRKPHARVAVRRVKNTPDCLSKAGVGPVSQRENPIQKPGTPAWTPADPKTDHESDFHDLA
jgi:hypothetical protein